MTVWLKQIATNERGDRRSPTADSSRPPNAVPNSPVRWTPSSLPYRPGYEAQLPRGGRRWIFFDQRERLPVLVITQDERGHEVEYYCYDRLQYPVKLDDDDFNPDKLWAKPKTPAPKAASGSTLPRPEILHL